MANEAAIIDNEDIKFIPKTRLQIYKALALQEEYPELDNEPGLEKYFRNETQTIISDKSLTFSPAGGTGNYFATLCNSFIFIEESDIVIYKSESYPNGKIVNKYNASLSYTSGDLYWKDETNREGFYEGVNIYMYGTGPLLGSSPTASVYKVHTFCTLLPKTPTEVYHAMAIDRFFNPKDLEPYPAPRTIDEKLTAYALGLFDLFEINQEEIVPYLKTRLQWYKAGSLGIVEEIPSELLPPKTTMEKYYAYSAGFYEGELPKPKTVNEYLTMCSLGIDIS